MTAVLILLWVLSGWWFVEARVLHWVVSAGLGGVAFHRVYPNPTDSLPGWHAQRIARVEFPGNWTPALLEVGPGNVWLHFGVLTLPFAGMAGVAGYMEVHARRRVRMGLCSECSYNRAGLSPTALCPECGAAAPTLPSA